MEEYKKRLQELKKNSMEWSVKDSQSCWQKYPGKMNKYTYNKCSKDAVISFHVYCEGRRQLKELKQKKVGECRDLHDPQVGYRCRLKAYQDLLQHSHSLEKWVVRERNKFLAQADLNSPHT